MTSIEGVSQGEAIGLCSCEGGVGNILESSSGRSTPKPLHFVPLVIAEMQVSSGALAGLLEPGGVATWNCKYRMGEMQLLTGVSYLQNQTHLSSKKLCKYNLIYQIYGICIR